MDRRNVKNIRIIKRLLESPDGGWTKYGLAKASGCSRPWVIEFLGTLERASLVSGTKVTDTMGLVKYGASIIPPPLRSVACHHQHPLKLLRTAGTEYAITTTYAENEVTHHLFKTRCDAYVTEGALKRLWKGVVRDGLLGKGNLRLMIPVDGDIITEARTIRGIRVVSMGQLMMDLMKEGGVGVQAVEEMVKRHVR